MNADRLTELTALNALGLLADAERGEFLALLAGADAGAQRKSALMSDALALAAVAQSPVKSPSAGLKSSVMSKVRALSSAKSSNHPPAGFYNVLRSEGEWRSLPVPGVRVKDLAEDASRGRSVKLYELAPGTRFPEHHHNGPEECFVVSGDFHVEGRILHGGDFHHAESETDHGESFTVGGCTLLVMVATNDYP